MKLFKNKITEPKEISVLFVCMGNICRSPTAHGVFQKLVVEHSMQNLIGIDSAGTYAYHAGEKPDPRARAVAASRGYDLNKIRARKVTQSDFDIFDYVLAMDRDVKQDLLAICDKSDLNKVGLFLDYSKKTNKNEVPDPYYGGLSGFETALDLIEDASQGLLQFLKANHSLKKNNS